MAAAEPGLQDDELEVLEPTSELCEGLEEQFSGAGATGIHKCFYETLQKLAQEHRKGNHHNVVHNGKQWISCSTLNEFAASNVKFVVLVLHYEPWLQFAPCQGKWPCPNCGTPDLVESKGLMWNRIRVIYGLTGPLVLVYNKLRCVGCPGETRTGAAHRKAVQWGACACCCCITHPHMP
jgi:hypothetical protein